MRTRIVAALQLTLVAGFILAWLFLGLDARYLGPRLDPTTFLAAHVGITGTLALVLCFGATWREPSRAAALGLSRVKIGDAILWGLIGLVASYVVATAAVALYFLGETLAQKSAATAIAMAPTNLPGGVVGKELAHKVEWASELGKIPLALAIPIALFAGFYEEVLFRGFVLGRLRVVLGEGRARTATAVVLSSALFAAGHGYQGGLGLAQTFAAGLTLATLAAYRRSIWPSIVAHALIDTIGLVALHVLRPMLEQLKHQVT